MKPNIPSTYLLMLKQPNGSHVHIHSMHIAQCAHLRAVLFVSGHQQYAHTSPGNVMSAMCHVHVMM